MENKYEPVKNADTLKTYRDKPIIGGAMCLLVRNEYGDVKYIMFTAETKTLKSVIGDAEMRKRTVRDGSVRGLTWVRDNNGWKQRIDSLTCPGGHMNPTDKGAWECGMREAIEETSTDGAPLLKIQEKQCDAWGVVVPAYHNTNNSIIGWSFVGFPTVIPPAGLIQAGHFPLKNNESYAIVMVESAQWNLAIAPKGIRQDFVKDTAGKEWNFYPYMKKNLYILRDLMRKERARNKHTTEESKM